MKRILTIVGLMVVCLGLVAGNVLAASGTLWDQEQAGADDGWGPDNPSTVEVQGQNDSATHSANENWVYQEGSGSWTGVYAGSDGWQDVSSSGDMNLKVEADVEMYFTQSVSDNEIYFHLGNIYEATEADKTAIVQGSFTSNNGQYIGISFEGSGKAESDFETDENGYTGVILGGMQSDHDTWRDQDNSMDIKISLNWGDGWTAPVNYGEGSHGTVTKTLWWLVDGGGAGTYDYRWKIELLPETDQPDGDYYLDPAVVAAPVL
jgi:hypothetical protein